ncbi:MAG TPA: GNAT family N-acetyltransferase [Ktedonobacterales bacterium]|nr:GNAT family N-acetyltransferase [Ktedonobacterales bacterium]
MSEITYRTAARDDVATLAALRWAMQVEHGHASADGGEAAYIATYVAEMRGEFERGRALAWIAEAGGQAVASVTLIWWVVPPAVGHPVRRRGQVSNVFTRTAYRRQGLARHLMRLLLDHARAEHIQRVVLWSSEMGEPLYRGLGFMPGRGMQIDM